MRARAIIFGVLAVVGAASREAAAQSLPVVQTEEVPVPVLRPWSVMAEMNFYIEGSPAYATRGVSVERSFGRFFAVDASVGQGLSSSIATNTGTVKVEPDLDTAVRGLVKLPLDRRAVSSLYVSVGPHYEYGGLYGDLWHGEVEWGYRLRTSGGFSLVYAVGKEIVLGARGQPLPSSECEVVCPPALGVGASNTVIRAALGYSF